MYVVHKITLEPGINIPMLPIGTELLHVAEQHGKPTLWYRRPVLAPANAVRTIALLMTGEEHREPGGGCIWRHIGTFMLGPYVLHAFELLDPAERCRITGSQLMEAEGR